jgi:hypothetical protein
MLAIVIVGFAPSYFLRGAVFAHLPSLLVHLHGAVFSSWIILFAIQSSLVSAGNLRLHRKLGVLGAVLAALMVVLGILTTFGTLRRAAVLPSFFTPVSFLIDNVLGILIFGAYVAFAIWKRNNRKVHKRILLIANVMLLPPALSRIPFVQQHPALTGLIPLAFLVALFLFDLFTWRRPVAATVVGSLIFILANPLMAAINHTAFAQHLTTWAQHHP